MNDAKKSRAAKKGWITRSKNILVTAISEGKSVTVVKNFLDDLNQKQISKIYNFYKN